VGIGHRIVLVYEHVAPRDCGFRRFNHDPAVIHDYLASVGSALTRYPYRANRALIFATRTCSMRPTAPASARAPVPAHQHHAAVRASSPPRPPDPAGKGHPGTGGLGRPGLPTMEAY
jgi:hypothetical protein